MAESTDIYQWYERSLSKYTHGFGQTVQAFSVGYLIYMLWMQVQFQVGKSQAALDQLRCSNGFTAFTPNYPEAESLSAIFDPHPLSPFGMCILISLLCVYTIALDTQDMASRIDKNKPVNKTCQQPSEGVSSRVVDHIFDSIVELGFVDPLLARP